MKLVEGAASVRMNRVGGGLYVNEYAGRLTLPALHALFARIPDAQPDARAILVRADAGAVLDFSGELTVPLPGPNEPKRYTQPGLVAVAALAGPECYGRIAATARFLQSIGLAATCWHLHQHGPALQWLDGCLELHGQLTPGWPPKTRT